MLLYKRRELSATSTRELVTTFSQDPPRSSFCSATTTPSFYSPSLAFSLSTTPLHRSSLIASTVLCAVAIAIVCPAHDSHPIPRSSVKNTTVCDALNRKFPPSTRAPSSGESVRLLCALRGPAPYHDHFDTNSSLLTRKQSSLGTALSPYTLPTYVSLNIHTLFTTPNATQWPRA